MTQSSAPIDPEALLAHGDFVRGIARSLLFDEHAADDVVQQTWMAALGSPSGTSRGWLGAVARNLAIKRLRGDRRRVARESAVARPEGVPSEEDVRERERLRRSVVDAVLALDEPYRSTVLLRWFDGLPPRGVAERMGVPVETVRTRTRRALAILRARLDASHGDDRGRFCAGLAIWAGGPRSGGAATAAGGTIMASKGVAAAAAFVVLGLGAYLLWPRGGPSPAMETAAVPARPPKPVAPAPAPARASPAAAPAETEPAAPPAPVSPVVKGRVVDTEGRPAAGLDVWITGPDVRPKAPPDGRQTGNTLVVKTGADGRFEAVLPSSSECQVQPTSIGTPEFAARSGDVRRVVPPAEGVDFVVDRHPTATLVVTALDADSGRAVAQFDCSLTGKGPGYSLVRSNEGKVDTAVRLASPAGDTVRISVSSAGLTGTKEVALRQGDRVEVRIDLQGAGAVTGRVTDAAGAPLAGALVWFGEEDVARGDEPFKPFDEKRVREGVRTDADGRFEIRGKGRWISFWHENASPVTVAAAGASKVTLLARGTIRGVLRGEGGAPVASAKLFLDRVRETTTDAEGRFEFDKVEAGTRGLSLTGGAGKGNPKAYVAVRVTAGETSDVELRPGLASVRIVWPGRTSFGRFVALLPLEPVGSLAIGQEKDGAIVAADVIPGRYLLMLEGGAVATADVAGAEATAVVGTGEVVVHAKAKTRLYVVPSGSGYLARLMGGRMAGAGVPADGVQRFTGLAPGRYEVGVECDGVRATVEVADAPVDVTID